MMMFCNKHTCYRLIKLFEAFMCFDNSEIVKKLNIKKIKAACLSPVFRFTVQTASLYCCNKIMLYSIFWFEFQIKKDWMFGLVNLDG